MNCKKRHSRKSGFILIATSLALLAILGMAGLAVDLGRMYIAKSELLAFTDAAAIGAALQLDGTAAGIARANNTVSNTASGPTAMQWDFATKPITGATTTFAKGQAGSPNVPDATTWDPNPANPADYRFVKVNVTAPVPLTFMAAFRTLQANNTGASWNVGAASTAAQVLITTFPRGLLPFSPIGGSPAPPNFGLTPGVQYTLRYPTPAGVAKGNICAGDVGQSYVSQLPSQDRGFWGNPSASAIRGEIIDDTQSSTIVIGDPVPMVGGAKTTEGSALDTRVLEDSDSTSATYQAYLHNGTGNNRRVIAVPVNNGPPDFTAIGIGSFLLLPQGTYTAVGPNDPICGEYIGPYVAGSGYAGAGATGGIGDTGGYLVRLTQ